MLWKQRISFIRLHKEIVTHLARELPSTTFIELEYYPLTGYSSRFVPAPILDITP
jgi:hypothetical protein